MIQVSFKKQVQEWKNILLRGSDYEQYQKYSKGFHGEETFVREEATKLQGSSPTRTRRAFLPNSSPRTTR